MTLNIHWKLFFYLTIGFIAAIVIGTFTHESGHYIAARSMGLDARINYVTTSLAVKERPLTTQEAFLFTLGGPLQTLLTGTIGLLLLMRYRRSFLSTTRLSFRQWLFLFLSFFWLRQIINLICWLGYYLLRGQFSYRADEIVLARHLGLPFWSLISTTGVISAIILAIVVFRFVPVSQRFTFILSGLVCGIAGYIVWLELLA